MIRYSVNGAEQIPDDDDACGFPGPPDEDAKVVVGKSSTFISLAPGESYVAGPIEFYPDHNFTKDFEAGAKYSYQYIGGDISWWNWGTKEVGRFVPLRSPTSMTSFITHEKPLLGIPQHIYSISLS